MKRIGSLLICMVLLLGICAPGDIAEATSSTIMARKAPILATGVKLNKTALTVRMGMTATLKATVLPKKATDKKVTWRTSDESIVKLGASGKITPVCVGSATITVETANGLTASCLVTVLPRNPGKVQIEKSGGAVYVGDVVLLSAVVTPADADPKITWSSSNKKVATVSQSGEVTAHAKGTAKITAKGVNGKKASTTIKVKIMPPAPLNANDMKFLIWDTWYTFPITEAQVPELFTVTRTYTGNFIATDDVFNYEVKRGSSVLTFMFDNYKWTGGPRELYDIYMMGDDFVSFRGIKKGDSLSKVKELYGTPFNVFTDAYAYEYFTGPYVSITLIIYHKIGGKTVTGLGIMM